MRKQTQNTKRGFTLVELMIVIAIIGILAAIAVPNFSKYRTRSYNAAANGDCRNAVTASRAFYSENPEGVATLDDLKAYGFRESDNVRVLVFFGRAENILIFTDHLKGNRRYLFNGFTQTFNNWAM